MLNVIGTRRCARAVMRTLAGAGIENLEPRLLLTTYLVTSAADSGTGTLRDAITQADANPGTADEIDFAIGSGTGPATITLASPLPVITDPLYVNGTSQPGYSGTPLIEISGWGLSLNAGNSTLRGLCIHSANKGPLVTLALNGGNTIQGCYLGTDPTGTLAVGNGEYGIYDTDTPNNLIGGSQPGQGNVISGSTANPNSAGIFVFGQGATGNTIQGNRIGTNATGTAAIPNTYGIEIDFSCFNTQIGGTTAGAANVISGNQNDDILLGGTSHNATIQGNLIGLNAAGTAPLSNNTYGIESEDSAVNTIGGTVAGARNVVSGHQHGIYLNGVHGPLNVLQGNYVGTDITGTVAIPNTVDGVTLLATRNTLGGTTAAARNIIVASPVGVIVGASGNVVEGNYVGLNAAGAAMGNSGNGILVDGSGSTIGGTTAATANVISANGNGIVITAGTTIVEGNLIGTNPAGTVAIPNASDGILISNGATNTIGGTTAGARNVISANGRWGVELTGTATGNLVEGNYVGTTAAGNAALGNGLGGILASAPGTTIGGASAGARNVVSANAVGISVAASGVTVQGNYVGTDVTGNAALPNLAAGVLVSADGATIGGSTAAARNIISANGADGVDVTGGSTVALQGNYIGVNAAGSGPLPNSQFGISVTTPSVTLSGNVVSANTAGGIALASSGALVTGNLIGLTATGAAAAALGNGGDGIAVTGANNAIGGATSATRNVISQNVNGISVIGAAASGNVIQGNYIGTASSGATAAANSGSGILVSAAASITIGGVAAGAGNVLSGNTGDGILFAPSTAPGPVQYLVQGNLIGTNASGAAALPNQQNGVEIRTSGAVIGGTAPGAGNVISGNALVGVICGGANSLLQGNYIGTDATGNLVIPNVNGVVLGANGVTIGGAAAGARNVISGNANGVVIGANSGSDLIQGNYIGTNAGGTAALPNSNGIKATGGGPVTIGGTATGAGNLISGNSGFAIFLIDTGGQSGRFTIQGNDIGTDATGAAALPNVQGGIWIQGMQGNLVGGQAAGAGNVIAFGGGDGIDVVGATATGNTISGNAIFSNSGLGIDLGADGTTPNDPADGDTGPNNLQNFPVLASAKSTAQGTTITGTLGSAPSSTYTLEFFATPPHGPVFLGSQTVTTDASGSINFSVNLPTPSAGGQSITATATDAGGNTSEFSAPVISIAPALVVARSIFYNDSVFDGNNPAATADDDGAIATDKQALLPGGTASFTNYTSYSRGINGIMVDVSNLPGTPTAADFTFRVGNSNAPASWAAAPAPAAVLVRPGAGTGGATRIEITWPDDTIRNTWLQVTVAANSVTGLTSPDVFYFGNVIGECGNSTTNALVDATDELAARNDPHSFLNPASITNPHDYNRDGKVDVTDQLIARNNGTQAGAAVQLISVPSTGSSSAAALMPAGVTPPTLVRKRAPVVLLASSKTI